ncbi:metallophosphoesterase [Curvibacter sp. CHRR-16]|uniref:metallophosphoesterase n=1 Tax=Curvibacter sp. CHRR-16 TaxID=2835872 RepID=UPI001BD9EA7E|nr:metallophosphoesterase [Curvibacter sp. CHRR-16]MBT0569056.1 metallophosphoesterase [Curvibacter sp. CHRR-16]
MASGNDYRSKLHALLSEGMQHLQPHNALQELENAASAIEALVTKLDALLREIERQEILASQHVTSLLGEKAAPADVESVGEFAFALHYLHNPPAELRAEVDAIPELKLLWDTLAAVARPSAFTPEQFSAVRESFLSSSRVLCDKWGGIYGCRTYEQADIRWAWTLKNVFMNHRRSKDHGQDGWGIRAFVTNPAPAPIALKPQGQDGKVRIAIIGDWGSGQYQLQGLGNPKGPAFAVMDTLLNLENKPDYIIHLGDTYYSGTAGNRLPEGEEQNNLLDVLYQYPDIAKQGQCFTLNSNHEMYGGAYGYFDVALADPLFSAQAGCSYFALEFGDWVIAGIDTAYFDPSNLYMRGGLGEPKVNPQYAFLQQITQNKKDGKKVILMSHHTGISTDGSAVNEPLWSNINKDCNLTPDYWYWGHTHLGMVYNDKAASKEVKTRCIGHSSMPFAIPIGMKGCSNVDWYANTELKINEALAFVHISPRAKNGFAMLTLGENTIREEFFDIGNTAPIYSL